MKKIITLSFFFVVSYNGQAMDPEHTSKKEITINSEDYKKYEHAALYCAALTTWLNRNYYFDEFSTTIKLLSKLHETDIERFCSMFRSLDDNRIKVNVTLNRNLFNSHSTNKEEQTNFDNPLDESKKALDELCTLLGYADNQPEAFEKLPRELRSFYSRFFSWPKLQQDAAILRGIENHQIPGLKRKEFETIQSEDRKNITFLFAQQGYDIDNPQKSTALQFKSMEEIHKKNVAVKTIQGFIAETKSKKFTKKKN